MKTAILTLIELMDPKHAMIEGRVDMSEKDKAIIEAVDVAREALEKLLLVLEA